MHTNFNLQNYSLVKIVVFFARVIIISLSLSLSLSPSTAMFLLDAYKTVYVWLGWWPQERRDWSIMRETNITTGSAHARWLRDKKLALETAQLYAKG